MHHIMADELIEQMEVEKDVGDNNINYPDGWKQRRKHTVGIFFFSSFIHGLEFTTIFSTIWHYVDKDVHDADPDLWYGLIAAGRFVAPILFLIPVSRWFDKTRSIRVFMVITGLLMNVGYVLYMVHSSPYIPVLGTILQGFSALISVVINSEIIRVYRGADVQRNYVYVLFAYALGEITGPLVLIPLKRVPNLNMGAVSISYGNIGGIVLLVFNSVRLVLLYFFAHDLSKEFDLKAQLKAQEMAEPAAEPAAESAAESAAEPAAEPAVEPTAEPAAESTAEPASCSLSHWTSSLKKSFTFDAVFLLVQQVYTGFFISFVARSFPLVVETFGYSDAVLNMTFIGDSVAMTVVSLLMRRMNLTSRGVYVCGMLCLFFLLLIHVLLYLVPLKMGDAVNISLLCALVLLHAFCWITDQNFIVVTLGNIFSSSLQSSVEGIRCQLHKCGSFTASLASAYIYRYFDYVGCVSVHILLCLLFVLIVRRKFLKNSYVGF